MVDWGYDDNEGIINFSFVNNKYYNFRTAGLFSDYIYNNYYSNNPHRTAAGIYWELQLHYAFYKSPMNWFFPNGREAWLDKNPSVGDPTSRFSEWLGGIFG